MPNGNSWRIEWTVGRRRMWVIDKFRNRDKRSNKLSFASSGTWFHLSESNSQIKSNMIQFLSANQVAIMPKATVGSSYVYFGTRPDPFINALLNKQRKQTLPHRRPLWSFRKEADEEGYGKWHGNPLSMGMQSTRGNLGKPCQFSQQEDQRWRTC